MKKIFVLCLLILGVYFCFFIESLAKTILADAEYISLEIQDKEYDKTSVLIVLTSQASKKWKDYSIEDFNEIKCINVDDLTSNYNPKKCQNSLETNEDFRRILRIDLSPSNDKSISEILAILNNRADVYIAEPNCFINNTRSINDEEDNSQPPYSVPQNWGQQRIQVQQAREYVSFYQPKEIFVGIIDTGVAVEGNGSIGTFVPPHDLDSTMFFNNKSYLIGNANFNDNPLVDTSIRSHGTGIAGIIGGKIDDIGVDGISNDITMTSLKVCIGIDTEVYNFNNFVSAFNDATGKNIRVINLSYRLEDSYSLYYAMANYEGLIVCSAGNTNTNTDIVPHIPSTYDLNNIITVGASDLNNNRWVKNEIDGSNYGATTVDVFAPGQYIFTCQNKQVEEYLYVSGTSYATAFVSGLAAYLLTLENLTVDNHISTSELKAIIMSSVTPISSFSNLCVSGGIINAYNATLQIHTHNSNIYEYYNSVYHKVKCECNLYHFEEHVYLELLNQPVNDLFAIVNPVLRCKKCGYSNIL